VGCVKEVASCPGKSYRLSQRSSVLKRCHPETVSELEGEDSEHLDVEFQEPAEAEAEAEESVSLEEISQWRVGKCLLALKKQIDDIAPRRNKASDGTIGDTRHCGRPKLSSDHCPKVRDGAIGVVTAMDISHDPNGGCDANASAESIRADRDPRVKYVIWNRRIFASQSVNGKEPWTWRTYVDSNPHTKHVHVSVKADKASFDSQEAWNLSQLQAVS
jgi:hypothetical protein